MKPFLKWAGGKRWLFADPDFEMPNFSGKYIEPFLGGGAVFFHLQPKSALIADVNHRLIETYCAIRDSWEYVYSELNRLQRLHSKEFYYKERRRVRRTAHTRAAQFLYLNRTCWNGLYRENLKGQFNVPIGTKTKIIFEDEDFQEISLALRGVEIECADFSKTIAKASSGDLVFVDPPYTTAHNMNGFVKYNQNIFSWDDQVRLSSCIRGAVDKGAIVVLTNADHYSIRNLYNGAGQSRSIGRSSVISGSSIHRKTTTEALYVFGRK